jgi:hypothetical protein
MKKMQEDLIKLFSQYEYVNKAMKFDLILLCIYPVYRILCLCPFEFIYNLYEFSTLFLLMFVLGIVFAFVNNKLKETILALGILTVVAVVDVFKGNFDGIVYAALYLFIAYHIYKFMNSDNDNLKETVKSKKCQKCGNVISDDNTFCTKCGEKID